MERDSKGRYVKGHKLTKGNKHPMFGKFHSKLTKDKMSTDRKGTNLGSENPFYGKKHTIKSRIKISKSGIGRKVSKETWMERWKLYI